MTLGKQLQKYRNQRGLSQKDIAQIVHTDPTSYSRWENDRTVPSLELIKTLAFFYGVSLDDLCDFSTDVDNRTSPLDVAINQLKKMNIKVNIINKDVIQLEIFDKIYDINNKDLPTLINYADSQYERMLVSLNKGLFASALSIVLNDYRFNWDSHLELRLSLLKTRIVQLYKLSHFDVSPSNVLKFTEELFILMPERERVSGWNELLAGFVKFKLLDSKDIKSEAWRCPFVVPDDLE